MSYDLFISYAHNDNERGQVRELYGAILADFHQFAGRDLRAFFDESDIPSMSDWEQRIAHGLRDSHLFLAVLSPGYFASAYCLREWEEFVRYEAMRQCLGEGVAPVYFIELPGLDGSGVDRSIAAAVEEMRKRQWCDLVSHEPVRIVPWHEAGKRALEDAEVARRLKLLQEQMAERLIRADRARQSPTNIYRHNPQFVGRVRELTLLREALNERGSIGVVGHRTQSKLTGPGTTAVHGLGGMGKTELSLAYAHAFAWDYPGGRWLISCEGLDDFDLALRQLAVPSALDIVFSEEEQKDAARAAQRVLAELRRRDRSLLLLDNVTYPELLNPDVLMRLPPQGHVHVLATTRLGPAQLGGSPHDHTFVAVDELPPDDSLALIRAHQPGARFAHLGDEAAARELVALLVGFTLAVETAAIYLGKHAAPGVIAAYTQRLRRELLAASEGFAADTAVGVRHKEKLLERTLALTFETLGVEHLHVLTVGALLPPDQVALPWLRPVAADRFSQLAPDGGADADAVWKNVEETLRGLRLFTPGQEARVVRMHRMIQLLIQHRARAGDGTGETKFMTLARLDEVLTGYVLGRGEQLSEAWEQHHGRWELQPLQSTAAFWLDEKRGSGYELACRLNEPLYELALYPEAERLARRALAFAETEYGTDSDEAAVSANFLGAVLKATNRLSDAEVQLRRVLASDEKRYGPDHPEVAGALNNLAATLHQAGRFSEAEPLLRRALTILESVTLPIASEAPPLRSAARPNRLALVSALTNLAEILEDAHRLKDAENLYRRALALAEGDFGPEHYRVGLLLNNLAHLLRTTNRVAEAETLMRRALAIAERTFGRRHPSFALRLNNLAEILREAERFGEAEPLYEEALILAEDVLGPHHPQVAQVLNNLAIVYRETGRREQAESQYRRALAIWEASYGQLHKDVSAVMGNLAKLLGELGDHDEAERLFRRTLEIDEALFGSDNPHFAPTLSNLAWLLCELKQFDEAESLSRRQLLIVAKTSETEGSDHVYLRIAAGNYFELLKRIGLSEATARARVDQALRGSGFSAFGPSISR